MPNPIKSVLAAKMGALLVSAAAIVPTVCAQTQGDSINYSYGLGEYPSMLKSRLLVKNGRIYTRALTDMFWLDISHLFNGDNHVGSGEITAFDAFAGGGEGRPFFQLVLTRGGKVHYGYSIPEQQEIIDWQEADESEFEGTGSGKIQSLSTASLDDGPMWFLVRNGCVYRTRPFGAGRKACTPGKTLPIFLTT